MIFPDIKLTRGYPIDKKTPPLRSVISFESVPRVGAVQKATPASMPLEALEVRNLDSLVLLVYMDVCENGVYTRISYFDALEWGK